MATARLTAALLGLIWIALGVTKLGDPGALAAWLTSATGLSSRGAGVASISLACGETLLGLAAVAHAALTSARRTLFALSWALGVIAAVATLVLPRQVSCGCFGDLGSATVFHRLIVAGAIQWLSVDTYFRLGATRRLGGT